MVHTIEDVGDVPGRDPLTDVQKQEIANEWNANAAKKPLQDWQTKMAESDSLYMTRVVEDIADALVLAGNTLPEQTLSKMAAKKALRATKPE